MSRGRERGTSRAVTPPDIFNRHRRRIRRDRAAPLYPAASFLRDWMVEGIAERLDAVRR
ncbi:MAG: SAM-dependent methyltransferase, partial [Alphaproteobacteria bacterium HGW-Alphaproteobacteria-16]